MNKRLKELSDADGNSFKRYKADEITRDEWYKGVNSRSVETKRLMAQKGALEDEISKHNAATLKGALSQVRPMGIEDQDMQAHLPGRSMVKQAVTDAYDLYPTDWISRSTEAGAMKLRKTDRGYYTDATRGEMAISGSDEKKRFSTAIHELGHRMEEVVPGMLQAEQAFYNRRTAGEKVERLKDVMGINYRSNELTRKDNFINPYMGKDYGGRYFELVSMGFQMAYTEPKTLAKDPDYQQFIYGLLAIG